ncbi:uncharacterized protein IL334_002152 [Kwoniella shivajii]|uniref:VHS domain-containing protein n=1 Tax=Kwoniella shivajii TaxID=564305 RepID=A0ABZ1CVK8_9TREE|nr:hypothetical protein IL334_002152 [Kwoniella shivajii]
MKRLFRTSKSPVVDPLPPPPIPTSTPASGTSTPTQHHHEHRWPFGNSHQHEVTPFPVDVGPTQTSSVSNGRKGKERGHSGGNPNISSIPSLLEIQQMKEKEQHSTRSGPGISSSPRQRMNQLQQQPLPSHQQPQPQQRQSRGYVNSISSPDGWTVVSPTTQAMPIPNNGYDPPYNPSDLTQPLPVPNASFGSSTPPAGNISPSSASGHTALYLPPGARPATPPSTRPPYPAPTGSARHSQSSLNSMSTAHYGVNNNEGDMINVVIPHGTGRERGHSVVSNTGSISTRSEHDTVNSNSTYTGRNTNNDPSYSNVGNVNQPQPQKLQKPQQLIHPSRSPLANSYPSPELTSFPNPHPYTAPFPPQDQAPIPYSANSREEMPNAVNLARRGSQADGHGLKEKKRGFLGMGWGKGKEKRESNAGLDGNKPLPEEPRRSSDGWRGENDSQPSSTHGHSTGHGHEQEDAPRGRLLGLDFGGGKKDSNQQPPDVNSAIKWLCTMTDPPPGNIYDVCDRIHRSEGADGIARDAARALRKEFKHGNENERRNAAKVWLYLMRNISGKGFRQNASSKKFLSSLEPILLAPATKPLVSQSTYRLITDILSDLTFSYGQEKGCEGLVEFWKKIKLPQESEIGNPLPIDHPIFSPEAFYGQRPNQGFTGPPAHSLPGSRRPSSPSLQNLSSQQNSGLPPPPNRRGPSPSRYGGPGYANLPSHGDDVKRLTDECTAAKESARVLSEALVFTRPEDIDHKPIIGEFYRKVFLAHESLTNQMDWAQAEASRSRESHASLTLDGNAIEDNSRHDTAEESALAMILDAHSALGEALKQHDDLSKLAGEEQQMREVRERSKKDTRMGRSEQNHEQSGLFPPANNQSQASSSRSPSPVPHVRLPSVSTPNVTSSPRNYEIPLPPPSVAGSNNPFRNVSNESGARSRTPSPDQHHPLPQPPKLSSSPGTRTASPLGRSRMGGPRPLPNPFAKTNNTNNASHQSLANLMNGTNTNTKSSGTGTPSDGPSRSGTGDTPSRSGTNDSQDISNNGILEIDGDDLPPKPIKPSRKALGKRRAVIDEDNDFDPNDMFVPNPLDPRAQSRDKQPKSTESHDDSSDEFSALNDENNKNKTHKHKIVYAYDAYEERQKELKKATEAMKISERYGGGAGGGSNAGQ